MATPYEKFNSRDLILRDELAIDRTALANERTFLAYVRTSLAFAITGAGAIKFLTSLAALMLGWLMLVIAVVIVAVGVWRFRRVSEQIARCRKPAADERGRG
jgi:putative membrane protein